MKSKASLDKVSLFITSIVFIIVVVVTYLAFTKDSYVGALITDGVLLIAYLFRPLSYVLTEETVIINRPVSKVAIRLQDIEQAKKITYSDLSITIRLFGSGGFFGYFGIFYSSTFGKLKAFMSQRKNLLLIKTFKHGTFVISPGDESFVQAVLTRSIDQTSLR
jgi:hypothetical protein